MKHLNTLGAYLTKMKVLVGQMENTQVEPEELNIVTLTLSTQDTEDESIFHFTPPYM